jgi:hypothetical protein
MDSISEAATKRERERERERKFLALLKGAWVTEIQKLFKHVYSQNHALKYVFEHWRTAVGWIGMRRHSILSRNHHK